MALLPCSKSLMTMLVSATMLSACGGNDANDALAAQDPADQSTSGVIISDPAAASSAEDCKRPPKQAAREALEAFSCDER